MTSSTTDRRLGLTGGTAIKAPCRMSSTSNITLSGLQTIDGILAVAGDRVLVQGQTSGVNNGIYVADTSTWTRDLDFDGSYDCVTGTLIYVISGTSNGNKIYQVTTTGTITIGTTSIAFAPSSIAFTSPSANSITTAMLQANAVTYANIQTMTANTMLGNPTSGAAVPSEVALSASQLLGRGGSGNIAAITLGTGLAISSTTLNVTGAATASGLTMTTLRLLGRTTASTGPIEEITVTGASLASGGLTVSNGINLGTPVVPTVATSITLSSSIPAGAKRISINMNGVSTNGTSIIIFQIGPSGGVETSGYLSSAMGANNAGIAVSTPQTIGFTTSQQNAAVCLWRGTMVLTLENSTNNSWCAFGVFDASGTQLTMCVAGAKSLAGSLNKIVMTTVNGTDSFDAVGEVNVTYE